MFLCLAGLALSAQKFERVEPFRIDPLEIDCSITLENADIGSYEISWSVPVLDSIARAVGGLPRTELHCFVYDSSGLIGSYTGLSTPMQHCDFQTQDSIVEVFFRQRKASYATYYQDSTEIRISTIEYYPFNGSPHRDSEYESVLLKVNSTTHKKVILFNDTNTVSLSHGTRPRTDPFGQPILGSSFSTVISLDRYYVNLKTGRIATGQRWVDRKGPQKMVRNSEQFLLIVPSVKYVDKNNNEYLGSELIRSRRVKLRRFNLQDFKAVDMENIPY